MFENIGHKIKVLATVACWIGIIGSVIGGIIWMLNGLDELVGIAIILGGSLISWSSSFIIYGFGELIEKATEIERNTRGGNYSNVKAKEQSNRRDKLDKLRAKGLISEEEYQNAMTK